MVKNKKKNKQGTVPREQRMNDTLKKTLNDLCQSLQQSKEPRYVEAANTLKQAMDTVVNNKFLMTLEDPESELFAALPVEVLCETENGRAYLDVLNVLTDIPALQTKLNEITLHKKMEEAAKKDLGTAVIKEIPEEIQTLAVQLQEELQLPSNIESIADLDLTDLFQKVTTLMDEKTKRGEIDVTRLHQQSKKVLEQAENSPLFKQLTALSADPTMLQQMTNQFSK